MARQPRLTVAAYPHHVIQRGNDRQAIVRDDADRERLLALWHEHAKTFKVAIHAYVIMDNHFHLLVTPETGQALLRVDCLPTQCPQQTCATQQRARP